MTIVLVEVLLVRIEVKGIVRRMQVLSLTELVDAVVALVRARDIDTDRLALQRLVCRRTRAFLTLAAPAFLPATICSVGVSDDAVSLLRTNVMLLRQSLIAGFIESSRGRPGLLRRRDPRHEDQPGT
jgi:hypothetical protein